MMWALLSVALASDLAAAQATLLLGEDTRSDEELLAERLAFQSGWASLESGEFDQALATFRALDSYRAAVGEVVALTRLDRIDEAGLRLQTLPADDEVLYLSAWVWAHQGEDEAAIALLDQIPAHSELAPAAVGLTELIEALPDRRRKRALAGLATHELHVRLDEDTFVTYVRGY